MTYKFSIYDFSDKEINQIVELAELWLTGSLWSDVDKRKYTKKVIEYGINWNLLIKGNDVSDYYKKQLVWKKFKPNRIYHNSDILNDFIAPLDMPIEALWRLFERNVLSEAKGENNIYGYSLSMVKGWINLNIRPNEHKDQAKYDQQRLELVLDKLTSYNYISWQASGTTWWIEIHPEKAYAATS